MDLATLYDEDFYAWSEQQAAVLRRLGEGGVPLPNDLDLQHVVEEVEDLGKAELRTVRSMLRQLFIHLIKLHAMPSHQATQHWMEEADTFRDQAADHYSRSMARHIELDLIWQRAAERVAANLEREGADPAVLAPVVAFTEMRCPFEVGDLFSKAPLADDLLGIIEAAARPPP